MKEFENEAYEYEFEKKERKERDRWREKDEEKDCDKCKEKDKEKEKEKINKVAIVCGHACDSSLNVLDCDHRCEVAQLEVDLKHFEKPLVKLDFSTNVRFRDLDLGDLGGLSAANASFTLKLFRTSGYGKKVCLGTWKFARYYNDISIGELGLFLAVTADTFSFVACDEPVCDECLLYTVEVEETTFDELIIVTKLLLTQTNFIATIVEQK